MNNRIKVYSDQVESALINGGVDYHISDVVNRVPFSYIRVIKSKYNTGMITDVNTDEVGFIILDASNKLSSPNFSTFISSLLGELKNATEEPSSK